MVVFSDIFSMTILNNQHLNNQHKQLFADLSLPLRSVGVDCVSRPDALMGEGKVFGAGACSSEVRSLQPRVEFSLLDLGGMPLLAGRTTPVAAREQGRGISSVTVCHQGSPRYLESGYSVRLQPGGILMLPRNGGEIRTGFLASLNFPIEHRRLGRTLRAMQAEDAGLDLDQPLLLHPGIAGTSELAPSPVLAFFSYLDSLLQESRYVGTALGLDEQIYRLVALSLLQRKGCFARMERRWVAAPARWSAAMDQLLEFIHAHAHLGLTLTDLEEQSHYSARRLQQLFQDRFGCTPMQYVRRQRLGVALQKLQTAAPGDSVTRIARDCGYRSSSRFSADFRQQYGRAPAILLRAARQRQPAGRPVQP
ncbi:MAG: helix-turn-helix transcriptional regulator [Synechococcus sp.]|nr:helix-turn-helix transcriptional regulator [Synechococcus sp.]